MEVNFNKTWIDRRKAVQMH